MELKIRNLSKRYPNGVEALKEVSLTIPAGMFGLLGPNGAGKSTLMRTLATLQDADSGSATLEGESGTVDVLADKDAIRKKLGYLPQEFGLYPRVTALEMLDHLALLKGLRDRKERRAVVEGLLVRTNLWDVRHRRLGTFSGGMKQRFGVAQALIGKPSLIIVDEPTAGLDPEERIRLHDLLSEIGENIIVILSTHIVGDVSDLCRQMAIINQGRVVSSGEPLPMIEAMRGHVWQKVIPSGELDRIVVEQRVLSTRRVAGNILVHVYSLQRPNDSFGPAEPDLEDVYFHALRGEARA
jgi:ABC-2 type transport system ATP-binding protein